MQPEDAFLTTERLILRAYLPEDMEAFARINSDPDVMRYLGGPRTLAETRAEMDHNNRTLDEKGYGKVAVVDRRTGTFFGMCGLSVEPWFPDLEIGWRLAPQYWGKGIATEAAQAWLRHAFETLGVGRVVSVSDVPNTRSIAVMERIGLSFWREEELEIGDDRFLAAVYARSRDIV